MVEHSERHPWTTHANALGRSERSLLVSSQMERLLDYVAMLAPVRDEDGEILDFIFEDANDAAVSFIGLARSELEGASVCERFPELPIGDMLPLFQAILDHGDPVIFEGVQIPDRFSRGKCRSFDVRVVPVDGALVIVSWRDVGEFVGFCGSNTPGRDRFRRIAERSSDIVIEVNTEGEIIWISPSVKSLLGVRASELTGTFAPLLVAPPDRERALRNIEVSLSGLSVTATKFRFLTASGREVWVSANAEPIFDALGAVQSVVIGVRNCQDEVIARRALETTTTGLSALLHAERGAVLVSAICTAAVEKGGYLCAWYGRMERTTGRFEIRHAFPADLSAFDAITITTERESGGELRETLALSSEAPTIVNDICSVNERLWAKHLEARGFRSFVALPVHVDGASDGIFAVFAGEVGAFDSEAVELLGNLSSEIGLGLRRLRERRRLDLKSFEYQRLAENASDVVYESDSRGIFVWVSPSIEQLLGWMPDELLGTRAMRLVASADLPRARQVRRHVYETGLPAEIDMRLLAKKGHYLWVSGRVQPIKDELGTVTSLILGLRNSHEEITTRRALQTMSAGISVLLHAEEEQALLDAMCAAAVEKGGYLFAWYGRPLDDEERSVAPVATRSEHRGYHDEVKLTWGRGELGDAPAGRSLRTGKTSLIANFETEAGPNRWREAALARGFRSSISLPVFVNGVLDGAFMVYSNEVNGFDSRAVTVLEDLAAELGYGLGRIRERERLDEAIAERDRARTEQELAARQLERLVRLESLGQLAGGVAHDFNNLLTVVMSYASLAQSELTDVEPTDEHVLGRLRSHVDKVISATEQAAQLTHQLLTFAQREPQRAAQVDLNEIVSETTVLLERVIESPIQVETHLAATLAPTRIDSSRMNQVLINLAVNARDAMPDGGTLTIETEMVSLTRFDQRIGPAVAPGEYVCLRVRDTGIGMAPDVRDRAFEPFFTTKQIGRGTGLGLATVYGVVSQAGGYVSVDSEQGKGTTVTVLLPTAAIPEAENNSDAPGAARTGATVLIVDDEPELLAVASTILEQHGYRVKAAQSGDVAIEMLSADRDVDLLVTDVRMPGMLGTELASQVQQLCPSAKVLFMSGFADSLRLPDLGSSNVTLVNKPFSRSGLLKAVQSALANAE